MNETAALTVGSLFSGIGGLDLGLERAGMNVIWQSEIDPYACRVLAKHWSKVPNHGDIKLINWGDVVRPDVICGGYPCQPFSTAGKRQGTDDPRHLWPWVRDAISNLRPDYAILENVRGHVSLGLSTVLGEMASIGYDAEWQIVSAASVGAPHRRDRVIIVAYPNSPPRELEHKWQVQQPNIDGRGESGTDSLGELAYPNNSGHIHGQPPIFTAERWVNALSLVGSGCTDVAYGQWWETEPDVGRVAHGVPSRVDRLRGLGNAVVPQVAELVGRMVVNYASHL